MPETASPQARKAAILDASTAVIRSQGLQALTFENIAQASGLSRQLVRYYYPALEPLMVDLCDHLAATYRDALVAGVVEIGAVERLDFFLDFFFGLAEAHPPPNNLEVYDAFFAFAIGSEPLRDRLCDTYRMLGQVFSHELAITHPGLDPDALDELSFLFVSMMHAHWSYVATLGYTPAHGRIARDGLARLIASYLDTPARCGMRGQVWDRGA